MKIAYVSTLVLFASFAGQSARAADWEVAASPSVGTCANSLVGVASAADIETLGETVRQRVKTHSGIDLEWEIKRIGVK